MPLTIEAEARINGLLDVALQGLDDQVLVSNGPCVNALLDLFGSSEDHAVRQVCRDALQRVGKVNLVRAEVFRADLQAVAAAVASATIETATIETATMETVTVRTATEHGDGTATGGSGGGDERALVEPAH